MPRKQNNELRELMNVGPKTLQDLTLLGIETVEQLSEEEPDRLYLKINEITEMKHDPCVWDIFAAIIDEAKTGNKKPWWEWTVLSQTVVMVAKISVFINIRSRLNDQIPRTPL